MQRLVDEVIGCCHSEVEDWGIATTFLSAPPPCICVKWVGYLVSITLWHSPLTIESLEFGRVGGGTSIVF